MPVMSVGWGLIRHRWASQKWSWCPAGILGNCPMCLLGTSPPSLLLHHAWRGGLVLPQPWIHTTKVLSHWATTVRLGQVSVTRDWVGTSSQQEHWAQILSHCTAVTSQTLIKLCLTLWSHGLQHTRLPCPPLSPGVHSNSCSLSQWCYLTISSSAAPFSCCLQSFPTSGTFLTSWLFASGGQSIGASASASVLPMNIQGWSPLGWTGLISLQSKGLSRVFSRATIWKLQFFSIQPSLWSNSDIHTRLREKT